MSNNLLDSGGPYTHFLRVGQTSGGTSLLLSDLNLLTATGATNEAKLNEHLTF